MTKTFKTSADKPTKMAFGLNWYQVSGDTNIRRFSQKHASEAKEPNELRAINMASITDQQFALGSQSRGAAVGAYAAAAVLAKAYPDRAWMIALELPDGSFWLSKGDQGLVYPKHDLVIEDSEEAFKMLLEMDPTSAAEVIVPRAWLEREELASFGVSDLMKAKGFEIFEDLQLDQAMRLKKIQKISPQMLLGAGAVSVLALAGFLFFPTPAPDPIAHVEPATPIQLGPSKAELQQRKFAEYDRRQPWIKELGTNEAFEACLSSKASYPDLISGYSLGFFECDLERSTVKHDFTVNFGYVNWIEEWFERNRPDSLDRLTINPDGSSFSLSSSLTSDTRQRDDVALFPMRSIHTSLISTADIEGAVLRFTEEKGVNYGDPEYQARYSVSKIEVATKNVGIWSEVLGQIPGFVITSISSNGEIEPIFTLKGKAYAALR